MNIRNGIFLWLASASLLASLLALAVLAFQFVLGRRLPAGWRYALWLAVFLVLVVPVLPANWWCVKIPLALLTNVALPRANVTTVIHALSFAGLLSARSLRDRPNAGSAVSPEC